MNASATITLDGFQAAADLARRLEDVAVAAAEQDLRTQVPPGNDH
ncbi:MAG: hypothetical protein O7H41_21045 [Planctomycetota bacterium]|nr:hypothetical protein [Planctomycetota bacterium]